MGATTTYDVQIRYMLEDKVSSGAKAIDASLRSTSSSASDLERTLGRIGGLIAGAFTAREAKKAFVDFNSNMEQAKITMAGMFELNEKKGFDDGMQKSIALVDRLQQRAKASAGTTADMVDMAQQLVQPLTAAGMSLKEIEDITVGTVVGAKAMNIDPSQAALDISGALRGTYNSKDRFGGALLAPMGFSGEEGRNKFNHQLTDAQRAQAIIKALNQKGLIDMAKAQESTWAGVTSTFSDNLSIALGKVGLPLFKALTAEVQKWNEWIDKNGTSIESMVKTLSSGMMTAFSYLKDLGSFFMENREVLLTIAAAWTGAKVSSGLISTMTGIAGALMGPTGAVSSLSAFSSGLTSAVGALGLLYVGLSALAVANDRQQGKNIVDSSMAAGTLPATLKAIQTGKGREAFAQLSSVGLASRGGGLNIDQAVEVLQKSGDITRQLGSVLGLSDTYMKSGLSDPRSLAKEVAPLLDTYLRSYAIPALAPPFTAQEAAKDASTAKPADKGQKVNVTINRIEVASDDPDRFAFGMVDALRDAARNPSSAAFTSSLGNL